MIKLKVFVDGKVKEMTPEEYLEKYGL